MKPISILLSIGALWTVNAFGAARPDLTGEVFTDAGHPLANATVFIYTAGLKVGVGTL